MTQVFTFHIDLTSTVAMVTENGRQYRLNRENIILDYNLEVLLTVFFFKIRYQNDILCILLFIIHLNNFLVFTCALC